MDPIQHKPTKDDVLQATREGAEAAVYSYLVDAVPDFEGAVQAAVARFVPNPVKSAPHGKHWSLEDEEELRRCYPYAPWKWMLRRFKRTREAITLHASHLKIKRLAITQDETGLRAP